MLNVSLFLVAGIFIGYLFRQKSKCLFIADKITTLTILLLLFLFGVSLGNNKIILNNLSVFGLQAAVIAISGVIGSVLLSFFTYKYCFKEGQYDKQYPAIHSLCNRNIFGLDGVLLEGIIPQGLAKYVLYALIFFVGISVGANVKIWNTVKKIHFKIILVRFKL